MLYKNIILFAWHYYINYVLNGQLKKKKLDVAYNFKIDFLYNGKYY